jgi:hypothetical protein
MTSVKVNTDNFARAESNRMFASLLGQSGGVNRWKHNRVPTPLDNQPVIRQNRDTLYSFAVTDVSNGATLTMPDGGDRYVSAMVVNQDHYINDVFHGAGEHQVTAAQSGTPHALIALRILVDPADPADVAQVNALQDSVAVRAGSATAFELPDYDQASFDATRRALLELANELSGYEGAFGRRENVDPVRHLLGTAGGWGGLPEQEAYYLNVDPGLPRGEYQLTVPSDVPVDGFWSVSLYNADGYFPGNEGDTVSVNSVTADREADGSVIVHFGGCADGRRNCLPTTEGWNYLVRMYQPRAAILDGSWNFPALKPAT